MESFDNPGFPPEHWQTRVVTSSITNPAPVWQRSYKGYAPAVNANSGSGLALFNSLKFPSGTVSDLITPPLDFSGGVQYWVSFSMYRDAEKLTIADKLDVYINTTLNPTGGTLLGTINRPASLAPEERTAYWHGYSFMIPAAYSGTVNYIFFRATSKLGNNILLDDITVAGVNYNTCWPPDNLTLKKLSGDMAEISWRPNDGDTTSYEWELRSSGAGGSGAAGLVSTGSTPGNIYHTSLSGLQANTSYRFYVRSKCLSTAESVWIPFDFTTACVAKNIPFAENFDGKVAPALPDCFSIQNVNLTTTWSNTNLSSSPFTPASLPNAMVYVTSPDAVGDDWFFTPPLNLTAGVNYDLRFLHKSRTTLSSGMLEVMLGTAPDFRAMTGTPIYRNDTVSNTVSQGRRFFKVLQSGTYYLGFHNVTTSRSTNSMLIDDISLDYGPDDLCERPRNVTVSEIGTNSAKLSWLPPALGAAGSYTWELRTSGQPGSGNAGKVSGGTVAAGEDSVLFNALSMGTSYWFYVKTNCNYPSYSWWSYTVSFNTLTTVCNPVTNLTANINSTGFKAQWTVPAITSPHDTFHWEVRTSGVAGSGATGLIQSGSTSDRFQNISGLNPVTSYRFYVRSVCASGSTTAWVQSAPITTMVANDECIDAVNLEVGKGFCTSPVAARMDIAKPTTGLSISCGTTVGSNTNPLTDVWFKLTIPETGNTLVETYTVNTDSRDKMMIAYTGSCGNLTEIACDRHSAPDDGLNYNSDQARIAFTGRTPGETIYIRVLPDVSAFNTYFNTGDFGIAAWDTTASVIPPIAQGSNCEALPKLSITATNKNAYRWNPIFDAAGNIVAEIRPYANIDDVFPYLTVNNNGIIREADSLLLLDRDLTLAMNYSPSSYGRIRLYFTEAEMQRLKLLLPALTFEDLGSVHISSYCTEPMSKVRQILNPIRGRYGKDYFIEVETGNRIHFYLYAKKLLKGLPVNPLRTYNMSNSVMLQWQTMKEANIEKFIIESSTDGLNFQPIAEVDGSALTAETDSTYNYAFTYNSAPTGVSFYRVKVIANDGQVTYTSMYKNTYQPVTALTATLIGFPVKLQWKTEIEINNKSFQVERSTDSLNFTLITTLPSLAVNGNSSTPINYTYIDSTPVTGMNYYRIRQIDSNDAFSYSDVTQLLVQKQVYTIDTLGVNEISGCAAKLFATISSHTGKIDSVTFEYGIAGFTETVAANPGNIYNTSASVEAAITGLLPFHQYRFRTKFFFADTWHYSSETFFNTPDLVTPEIQSVDGSAICEGGSLMLTSSAPNGNQWLLNGQEIDGAVNEQLEATVPGNYTVLVKEHGCISPQSAAVEVKRAPTPAIPQIQAPDGTNVCDGKTVKLIITAQDGISYQWLRNGVIIRGADQPEYIVASGASYSIELTNSNNCSVSSLPISVTVLDAPAAPVISVNGPQVFCTGDSTFLMSSANSYWYKDGTLTSADTAITLKVNATGSYYAVQSNGSCKSLPSDTINITVKLLPTSTIAATAATTFCEGGKLMLQATEGVGYTYQWMVDGRLLTNATASSYEADASGAYRVLTTSDGCTTTSAEIAITVKSLPAKPVISVSGNALSSSAVAGNQWQLNGIPIPGATGQEYIVQAAGVYTVVVTRDECSNKSEPFNFVATGIVDPQTFSDITVYPNPIRENLVVKNEATRKLILRLTDAYGRIIFEKTIQDRHTTINTEAVPPGSYLLIITDVNKKQTVSRKLIKI